MRGGNRSNRRRQAAYIRRRRGERCTEVSAYWKHWPCFIPQHGRGPKHLRRIALSEWQRQIVMADPRPLLRGLIQSRFLIASSGRSLSAPSLLLRPTADAKHTARWRAARQREATCPKRRFPGGSRRRPRSSRVRGPDDAATSSATPARLKDRAGGYSAVMADQSDRERESRESPVTKFEEIRLEDEAERERAAERLRLEDQAERERAAERLKEEQEPDQNEP
jgi:hypothetical protein